MPYNHKFDRLELRFQELPTHLRRLDRDAAEHVTKHFESIATLLRQNRRQLDAKARQMREIARAARQRPAYPDTPSGRRMRQEAEGKARAIEIMRLASRGWSNTQIGRKFAISAGQVSRIIRRQLQLTRRPCT